MTFEDRAWDELRAAGGELSACYSISRIAAVVCRVARQFEVPRSPEAEAVEVFLAGLLGALSDAGIAAKGEPDAAQLPDAAQ